MYIYLIKITGILLYDQKSCFNIPACVARQPLIPAIVIAAVMSRRDVECLLVQVVLSDKQISFDRTQQTHDTDDVRSLRMFDL